MSYINERPIIDAKGFSLVEVLIAMTILSIGILGIAGLAGTGTKAGAHAQAMTQATNIAQNRIEALQSIPFRNLQLSDSTTTRTDLRRACVQTVASLTRPVYSCTPTSPIVLGTGSTARTYTWSYTVAFIDTDNSGAADEMSDALKRLDVAVQWADQMSGTTKTTTISTVLTK